MTCVHFGLSFLSVNLLVFLHKGVVFLRYYSPGFFCSFATNRSMCAWRNLNSTPYVFTGDGLKHQPVPDLTLTGTPFKAPGGLAARLCWFLGLPINKAYFFTIPDVKMESCQKWEAVSFIVCVAWIAVSCYTLVWMVTIIGYSHLRSWMQSWVLHSSLLEAVYQLARRVCSPQ